MPKVIEGVLDAKGRRFGIVVSRFNKTISVNWEICDLPTLLFKMMKWF